MQNFLHLQYWIIWDNLYRNQENCDSGTLLSIHTYINKFTGESFIFMGNQFSLLKNPPKSRFKKNIQSETSKGKQKQNK